MLITFGWGGCGNLIKNCLTSNTNYDQVMRHYYNLNIFDTWTNQEWFIRNDDHYQLSHEYRDNSIKLAWSDPLDTSFHYILKNINLNHLTGDMPTKINGVLSFNHSLNQQLKQGPHTLVDQLLVSPEVLYAYCTTIDPAVKFDRVANIYALWKLKTQEYYYTHSSTVITHFAELGIDYSPTTLYNILYENSYT